MFHCFLLMKKSILSNYPALNCRIIKSFYNALYKKRKEKMKNYSAIEFAE